MGIRKNIALLNHSKTEICNKIAEARKMSGQTQQEVASWCNMSTRTYIELEKGNCTMENMCDVADKFSIEIKMSFEVF